MMVDQTPAVNFDRLFQDLDHTATKLIGKKENELSKQELTDLLTTLKHVNSHMDDPGFWEGKKLDPEGKAKENATIEKALKALDLFQSVGKRSAQQAIVSLFSQLKEELNALNSNLRNLKDFKIGQKVEKTRESKQS